MNVRLVNIQSIRDAEYDLGDKGIVQIQGANSNGKSIIVKAISAVVSLKIKDSDIRESLISDGKDVGYVSMEYNGKTLMVQLHRDRNQCAMLLQRVNGETVQRTFRDGGLEELIYEFGFRCYNKNGVCLQLYETFGQMPFVNTSLQTNCEMVEAITQDTVAESFLKAFKEVTHPRAREQVRTFNKQIENTERIKQSMVLFDYEAYEAFRERIRNYYDVLSNAVIVDLEELRVPAKIVKYPDMSIDLPVVNVLPSVEIYSVEVPELEELVAPIDLSIPRVQDVTAHLNEMKTVREGKCPTCGKLFIM